MSDIARVGRGSAVRRRPALPGLIPASAITDYIALLMREADDGAT